MSFQKGVDKTEWRPDDDCGKCMTEVNIHTQMRLWHKSSRGIEVDREVDGGFERVVRTKGFFFGSRKALVNQER